MSKPGSQPWAAIVTCALIFSIAPVLHAGNANTSDGQAIAGYNSSPSPYITLGDAVSTDGNVSDVRIRADQADRIFLKPYSSVYRFDMQGEYAMYGQSVLQLNSDNLQIGDIHSGDGLIQTLSFLTGNSPRMSINSAGSVGIGTVDARTRLDVNGNAIITGQVMLEGDGRTIGSTYDGTHNDFWKIFMDGQTNDNGALHIRTGDNGNEPIFFEQASSNGVRVPMIIAASGKVGIGTDDPYEQLHVVGTTRIDGDLQVSSIRTKTWTVAPDYVFEKDYKLRSLEEVDAFVKKNKHLPEVPSAKMIKEKGLDLADMNLLLLKKVEELTLHAIRQEKEMNTRARAMETELARQAEEIRRLRHRAK